MSHDFPPPEDVDREIDSEYLGLLPMGAASDPIKSVASAHLKI